MQINQCHLCKSKPALKKNSHIISKFLCKGLFESINPRHILAISKKSIKKVQDTPKENFILCVSCEKRIEILETCFAKIIGEINNYLSYPKKFNRINQGYIEYIDCKEIHPVLYKLFIYSLVWRASISNLVSFQRFKLPEHSEEELRQFLNTNLTTRKTELVASLSNIKQIPEYHSCLIKPKVKSRGIFTAYNANKSLHLLLLVDFGLLFYTDENSISPDL